MQWLSSHCIIFSQESNLHIIPSFKKKTFDSLHSAGDKWTTREALKTEGKESEFLLPTRQRKTIFPLTETAQETKSWLRNLRVVGKDMTSQWVTLIWKLAESHQQKQSWMWCSEAKSMSNWLTLQQLSEYISVKAV